MENDAVLVGAQAPRTKLLNILTIIFGSLIVTMGLFEYMCVKLDIIDLCDILGLYYNGLNAHEIIFYLMYATLVVVTIAKNKQRRFNGWLVLAVICTFCSSSLWQFRHSLFLSNLGHNVEDVVDVYIRSYALLTLVATYCMALLPLLWKRNKWSITIAIAVAVMIFCQRIVVFAADYVVCDGWYFCYEDCRYTFGFLLFYNLMPILITLLLFYVMLRDAITSANVQPAMIKEAEMPANVVYCCNCGKPHAEDAEFCMNCGVRVGVGDKYCRVCGAKPDPLAEICVRCKTELKR